jgi:5-methylcytosine-specific restriction protein A
MPPKPCRVCQRLHCSDPAHVRKPFAGKRGQRRLDRPQANSGSEIRRRREAVAAWRAQHGDWCPRCNRHDVKLTAEHVAPFAESHDEGGPLSVLCVSCQGRQGARIANTRRRRTT